MYESEENLSNNRGDSSCDKNEYGDVLSVEVLCREEESSCGKDFDFHVFSFHESQVFLNQCLYLVTLKFHFKME